VSAARLDHERFVARIHLDDDVWRLGPCAVQQCLDGLHQPAAPELVVSGRLEHERRSPPQELVDNGAQLLPPVGEAVQGGGDRRLRLLTLHDALSLQLAQPVGEQVGGDARKPVSQIRVPAGPDEQLADDQQRPPLVQQLHRLSHRAELVI
jgi:hypothetical protein